jgi:hypothetical protein
MRKALSVVIGRANWERMDMGSDVLKSDAAVRQVGLLGLFALQAFRPRGLSIELSPLHALVAALYMTLACAFPFSAPTFCFPCLILAPQPQLTLFIARTCLPLLSFVLLPVFPNLYLSFKLDILRTPRAQMCAHVSSPEVDACYSTSVVGCVNRKGRVCVAEDVSAPYTAARACRHPFLS